MCARVAGQALLRGRSASPLDGSKGHAVPVYKELYPVGTEVRVLPRGKLEDFQRTWRYHHALQDGQLPYAGAVARIATVAFYHGGDVLYTLENIPGIWHEVCLDSASTPHAV